MGHPGKDVTSGHYSLKFRAAWRDVPMTMRRAEVVLPAELELTVELAVPA
jgi:hypothetical protein